MSDFDSELFTQKFDNDIARGISEMFRPKFGIAMGTSVVPCIVNISYGGWSVNWCLRLPGPSTPNFGAALSTTQRYYGFGGEESLKDFLHWLNQQHPSIKFTANYRRENVTILEVNFSIVNSCIITDLHTKSTDAQI